MAQFMHGAIAQQHFDDIKADFHRWVLEQAQVIERRARKAAPALRIDGGRGTHPFLGRASLDFHKHQAILVPANQIDLTSLGPEVRHQKFEALRSKIFLCRALSQFAMKQVKRLFRMFPPGFEVLAKIDSQKHVWYAAMRIPFRAIDSRTPAIDNTLRINLFRSGGPPTHPYGIAWQPTMSKTFHVPEKFGLIKLVEEGK